MPISRRWWPGAAGCCSTRTRRWGRATSTPTTRRGCWRPARRRVGRRAGRGGGGGAVGGRGGRGGGGGGGRGGFRGGRGGGLAPPLAWIRQGRPRRPCKRGGAHGARLPPR